MNEASITKFGTQDDLEEPSCGYDFISKIYKVKITRLESIGFATCLSAYLVDFEIP